MLSAIVSAFSIVQTRGVHAYGTMSPSNFPGIRYVTLEKHEK